MTSLITSCANNPNGKSLEQLLGADPRLKDTSDSSDRNQQTDALLPPDFPSEIPRYPNARLQEVIKTAGNQVNAGSAQVTRWLSSDSVNLVKSFYQQQFQSNNWDILSKPADEQGGNFEARRNNLQVRVSIQPSSAASISSPTPLPSQPDVRQNPELATEFVIQYDRNTNVIAVQPTNTQEVAPQPGTPDFIGPLPQTPTQQGSTPAPDSEVQFTDLNKAPQELRQYIEDVAALGVLSLEPANSKTAPKTQLEPNKIISRREYARWLVAANNQLHANSPAQQIRGASPTAQPAFQDVPPSDPDFPIIQGLAEAGLIPSLLSGDATAVLFRPDAPLTREQLILWKVPLDTRQALPNASVDAVKQTWGFQDASRLETKALRAVLADFQNGEQSNIRRVFGYTTLFQPKKPVTRAEAAAALWYFGTQGEGVSAKEALQLKRQQSQPSASSEPVPSRKTPESSSANQ